MRRISRLTAAAVAVCVSASLTGGIAVAQENPSTESGVSSISTDVHFDVYRVEAGVVSVELSNGEFEVTPTGEAGIVDANGNVVEVFPESLGEYEVVAPNEIIVAQHGTENSHSISSRGFCPLGHNNSGGCRGGGVAKGAGKGAVTGGVAGCVTGAIGTGGPGCPVGGAVGAAGGAAAGAVGGALGW